MSSAATSSEGGGNREHLSSAKAAAASGPESSAAKLDLARLLLTPAALDADEWVKGRIRWHRLDGNDELADEMLRDENSVRSAIGKEPLDIPLEHEPECCQGGSQNVECVHCPNGTL